MPTTYSLPSLRQYLTMPEILSHRDWIFSLLPAPIGVLRRMHAPPSDLSSTRAETVCEFPLWSFHDTSTRIMTGVRSSYITPLWQFHRQKVKRVQSSRDE